MKVTETKIPAELINDTDDIGDNTPYLTETYSKPK